MHPAINIANCNAADIPVRWKHVTGATRVYDTRVVRSATFREEPESVSNPVRQDGTRASSAYHIYLLTFASQNTAAKTSREDWGWNIDPMSQTDAWTELPMANPATLKGTWSSLFSSADEWHVQDTARTRLLNKLADRRGLDAELGVATGEFRETVGMARELTHGLVEGVRNIARSTNISPQKVSQTLTTFGELGPRAALQQLGGRDTSLLQNIVKGWLVTQFGLKPLYGDLLDATALYNRGIVDGTFPDLPVTIRAGHSDEREWQKELSRVYVNYNVFGTLGNMVTETAVHFAVRFLIPTRPSLFQETGFENSASVAWELCRYSWLVDYALKVGPWLRGLYAGADCTFVEGTMSMKCETRLESRKAIAPPGVTILVDPTDEVAHLYALKFERTLLGGFRPAFLPSLADTLGTRQLANALSALAVTAGVRARDSVPVIRY